jgi:hypothetical protein
VAAVRGGRLSQESTIGVGVTALALAAMAVEHLLGDDPGLEDPPAFALSVAVIAVAAFAVFWVALRRARRDEAPAERAAGSAIVASAMSGVTLPFLFLGAPFVFSGGGIALGLMAWEGSRRRLAATAIALGGLILALGTAAYTVEAIAKLT